MIRVSIQQPVVASYRLALFNELESDDRFRLQLFASEGIPGCPPSCLQQGIFQATECEYVSLAGDVIVWQKSVREALEDTDVLVVCGNPRYLSSLELLLAAKRRGISTIWWGHGWSATSKPWRTILRKWFMKNLPDLLLLYTQKEADDFIEMGFRKETTLYLNNTIDTRPMETARQRWSGQPLEEFKRKHELNDKITLLYCGRMTEKSDLSTLIQAMAHLKNESCDAVRLIMIGDGESLVRSKQLSSRLGLDGVITWCGSIYPEYDLAPWFMSSSLFVFPGSIGLSINHAFAYGLPVITHNNPLQQGPEFSYLREGINGCTFRRSDSHGLSSLIRQLIDQPDRLEWMSREAMRTIREVCPFDGMVRRFGDALMMAASGIIQTGGSTARL